MNVRRLIACLLACMAPTFAVGCHPAPPPERTVPVSNSGFHLDQLFTDDRGYTVNRFYDQGEWRYYVVSPDGHAQMVPTTRVVHDADGTIEPGLGVGVGVGAIRGGRR